MIGIRLAHYEFTAKLGEGGMGEVYRATDTKLKREVAIKVLPAAFTADKERLARFEREAQLLAQLHHPNIASIFGLEESEGIRALVMELVEGPTLAERLESGPLSFAESLSVALQIAQALDEAHEKGIVHRDLKPQNIKASSEGKVKVLDFGLAKAMDLAAAAGPGAVSPLAQSPTLTFGATQLGVILGTAAYMSPEQAKGIAVDKRADIWAFGVVLYEMLTGRRLFAGDSVPETLAGVLKSEIDFAALPATVPPAIRRLLRRCLQRRPQDRLRDIGDARLVISDCLSGIADEPATIASEASPAGSTLAKRWLPVAAATALLGGLLGYLWGSGRSTAGSSLAPAERRFVIAAEGRVPSDGQAIAPDGERIVYTAGGGLWLRALAEVEPRRIAGGDGASEPFFSPDGREVAFLRERALWRLAADGGAAKRICEIPAGTFDGGTWGEDGAITFALAAGGWSASLHQCPAAGGGARLLLAPDAVGFRLRRPQALPGGAGVLYTLDDHSLRGEIRIVEKGASRALLRLPVSVGSAVLSSDRRLYLSQERNVGFDLWSVPLDGRLEKPLGEPTLLAQGGERPSMSRAGALLFARVDDAPRRLAWVDRDGSTEAVGETFLQDAADIALQVSPDAKRAALLLAGAGDDTDELWIFDLERGARQRLPVEGVIYTAAWSPDGREILVSSGAGGIVWPIVGGGSPRKLTPGHAMFAPRYSPDGKWILYYAIEAESGRDILRLAVDGGSAPEPLVRQPGQQTSPDLSPDGRFLAYQSDESGRAEIYVRPLSAGAAGAVGERKWQVTSAGGASPIWNRRGGELVWLSGDAIWAAAVRASGDELELGPPQLVVRGKEIGADLDLGQLYYNRMYDLAGDGRRFLVAQRASEGKNEIVYVEHPGGAAARH